MSWKAPEVSRYQIETPKTGSVEFVTPAILRLKRYLEVLLDIKRSPFRLPFSKALRAWRLGFTEWSYLLYDLDNNKAEHYLSDRAQTLHTYQIMERRKEPVLDKWNFSVLLESVGCPQPDAYGRVLRGVYHHLRSGAALSLGELLEREGRLVLKPTYGCGGWGVLFLEYNSGELSINGVDASHQVLQELLQKYRDAVVTGFAEQADYSAKVFPASTNTLRILVLQDDSISQPYIAAAAHRFGLNRSQRIDNFHGGRGGLSAPISASGVLGGGVTLVDGQRAVFSHHPDTGAAIEGLKVPDWERVTSELLDIASRLPFLRGVGWDLVKTNEGWECLEGNPGPGTKVWQVHGGLLADDRNRRFYSRYGMC